MTELHWTRRTFSLCHRVCESSVTLLLFFLGGQCGRIKYIVQVRPLTRDSVRCGPLVMLGAPREAAPPAPHTETRAVQPNTMNVLKKRFSEHLSS